MRVRENVNENNERDTMGKVYLSQQLNNIDGLKTVQRYFDAIRASDDPLDSGND